MASRPRTDRSEPREAANGQLSVAECEDAAVEASAAVSRLENMVDTEKREASVEIDRRYAADRAKLMARLRAARTALTAAKDAKPDHPWTGKRVYRMDPGPGRWRFGKPDVRIEGVVDTYRSSSPVPANTSRYRLPQIGQGIVRFLKKDGEPGARFEVLDRSYRPWQLCDADAAEGAPSPDVELGPGSTS